MCCAASLVPHKGRFTSAARATGPTPCAGGNGECRLWQRRYRENTRYVWPHSPFHRYACSWHLHENWAGRPRSLRKVVATDTEINGDARVRNRDKPRVSPGPRYAHSGSSSAPKSRATSGLCSSSSICMAYSSAVSGWKESSGATRRRSSWASWARR